jgi:MFS family permease
VIVRVTKLVPAEGALRRLAAMTLVNTFGNGLYMTLSALYFTRIVGLSVTQVGLGLTIAGGVGVAAGVPFGHAADRVGARPMLIVLMLAEAIGTACYVVVGSFAAFLAVATFAIVADRASNAVRNGLYAHVLPAEGRTQARAYLRSVTNVGIGAGAAMAAVALQADTKTAYVFLILLDVLTFLVSAAILRGVRVPMAAAEHAPRERATRRRNPALRDRPYLAVTGLNALLVLQFGLLEVGLPLWIVGHTDAPRLMVSLTLLLNTVLVVVMQVPASRGVTDVTSAARAAARGGLLMAGSCLLLATAHGVPAWATVALLLSGVVVQTLSEVTSSAAGWALSYDLADEAHHGAYQGVYSSGFALAFMLAPIVVTSTALRHGFAGWCVLAAIFAAAGLTLIPATAWAESRRTPRITEPVPDTV